MPTLAPWHARLAGALGLAETPGPGSTDAIMAMVRTVAGADPRLRWIEAYYGDDDVPWCGLALAWAMVGAGIAPPVPNPLAARAWGGWGVALRRPVPGAVLVFARGGGGHVGLYEGEDRANFLVLGGNQANRIGRDPVPKARLLPAGIRWPAGVALPEGAGPVAAATAGRPVLTDER